MDYDPISIVALCGLAAGLAFAFATIGMIFIAVHIGRSEFRSKGFLRLPSGFRWFRFLLMRQYDAFDNPRTRLFFGYAHFCLMGVIISATAILVLLGCVYMLRRM